MSLFKRLGFYLGGFAIGLIFLAFFFSGKRTSCDYSPSARVKKNIRIKQQKFSIEVLELIESNIIDTSSINYILKTGSVNFSKSNTKLDSCKIYVIEGVKENKELSLSIENCDSIATIQNIEIKKDSN